MNVDVASMPFADIARAIETDETAGLMKLIIDPSDERILGATLVGADAGELIHIFIPLIQARATARSIVDAEFDFWFVQRQKGRDGQLAHVR